MYFKTAYFDSLLIERVWIRLPIIGLTYFGMKTHVKKVVRVVVVIVVAQQQRADETVELDAGKNEQRVE